jgi:hypothetical protein
MFLQTLELFEGLQDFQVSKNPISSVRFKGSKSKSTTVPRTSADQQETAGVLSDYLQNILQQGVPGFEGQLTADIPQNVFDAFDRFTSEGSGITEEGRAGLESLAAGESFFDSDPEQIIQDWREGFANPATAYYNEFVRPEVREEFNVPGGFNTSERAEGVSRAFNEFYGSSVAPTLFQAQENEKAREFAANTQARNLQLPAIQFSQALPTLELGQQFAAARDFQGFEQAPLTAKYNEFLRQALGNLQTAQLASGFSTQSTQDNIFQPAVSSQDKTLALVGTLASAAAAGA